MGETTLGSEGLSSGSEQQRGQSKEKKRLPGVFSGYILGPCPCPSVPSPKRLASVLSSLQATEP